MQMQQSRVVAAILVSLAATLTPAGVVLAERPDHAGGSGKSGQHERKDKGHGGHSERGDADRGPSDRGGRERTQRAKEGDAPQGAVRFETRHRTVIREYFAREVGAGHCPPGLAKKGNGCRPPGLAKKWSVGRALPRDVVYYELPPAVVVELGVPPPGHKFVRIAGDILMIAIGTGLVVDAIEDLGGL